MLNYTIIEVVRQEYLAQLRRKPIEEGVVVYEAAHLWWGLDGLVGLLAAAKQRLRGPAGPVGVKSIPRASGD